MELSQNGHEDMETATDMRGEDGIPADSNVEGSISGFIKAMGGISVGGVDCYSVAAVLESKCHVDDKPFRTSNSQVGVDDGHIGGIETRHVGLMCKLNGS